jgi:hypothetical protein
MPDLNHSSKFGGSHLRAAKTFPQRPAQGASPAKVQVTFGARKLYENLPMRVVFIEQ